MSSASSPQPLPSLSRLPASFVSQKRRILASLVQSQPQSLSPIAGAELDAGARTGARAVATSSSSPPSLSPPPPPLWLLADKSPKGNVDDGVWELINEINAVEGLVTTSSCAGRVSCF